jgi:hypothetical protein
MADWHVKGESPYHSRGTSLTQASNDQPDGKLLVFYCERAFVAARRPDYIDHYRQAAGYVPGLASGYSSNGLMQCKRRGEALG